MNLDEEILEINLEIFVSICALAVFGMILWLYVYSKFRIYKTWSRCGVRGPNPTFIFGNIAKLSWPFEKLNLADFTKNIYDEYDDQSLIGIYQNLKPTIMVKDPKYIKDILITDFKKFADRGIPFVEEIEPLTAHLINLEVARWQPLRKIFSPMFSSGKLKKIFPLIVQSADNFPKNIDDQTSEQQLGSEIECRGLTAQYTTKVIGACIFGLDINKKSPFCEFGRAAFVTCTKRRIGRILKKFPKIFEIFFLRRVLKYFFYEPKKLEFFVNVMKDTMEIRKKSDEKRGDCIDMIMQIEDNQGKLIIIFIQFFLTMLRYSYTKKSYKILILLQYWLTVLRVIEKKLWRVNSMVFLSMVLRPLRLQ